MDVLNSISGDVDSVGFEARLAACSESLRELVSYLRASARHAAPGIAERRFRHPEPNSGWGVTYYTGVEPFCEIHPKLQEEHVWVLLRGIDTSAVAKAGFEPSKQEGWFKIHGMEDAVRFVHWILQAHDARASTAAQHQPAAGGGR